MEGVSEELLIASFCRVEGFALEDYRIELVNVDGISFYPFLFLFNSSQDEKRINKRISVLTDDDRFPESKEKEYNIDKLIENNFAQLDELHDQLVASLPKSRITNLNSVKNKQVTIDIQSAWQTMEFDLCLSNVPETQKQLSDNFLFKFIEEMYATKFVYVQTYLKTLPEKLDMAEKIKISILLWKCLVREKADGLLEYTG